jgi:Uma2 family endonuclease
MASRKPRPLLRIEYERAAEAYLRSLPLEHFMEATPQATQREITVESLALVHARRPDVQYFNELCVQYPIGKNQRITRVVPDNMVVVHPEPIKAVGSYDLPFQPAGPYWMLEYVFKSSERKDYEESFRKDERELKVPYYLVFYPEAQEVTLFHLRREGTYRAVPFNAAGRLPIRKLDMETAILDGWVRFWYQGKLLPLPAELQHELNERTRQLLETQQRLQQAEEQLRHQLQDAERLRAQLRAMGIEPSA